MPDRVRSRVCAIGRRFETGYAALRATAAQALRRGEGGHPCNAMQLMTHALDAAAPVAIPEGQPLPPEDRILSPALPPVSIDELYRTQAPRLLRYFRRSTGNASAAADLVQDAFSRFIDSERLPELLNPAAYLQRIARNLLIDQSRRPVAHEVFVPLEEWDAKTPPTQEDALLAQDLLHCYETAIAALPERTRMIFLLQRADDLTYREIAKRLGVQLFTVQYHMKRAIAHLDRALTTR